MATRPTAPALRRPLVAVPKPRATPRRGFAPDTIGDGFPKPPNLPGLAASALMKRVAPSIVGEAFCVGGMNGADQPCAEGTTWKLPRGVAAGPLPPAGLLPAVALPNAPLPPRTAELPPGTPPL